MKTEAGSIKKGDFIMHNGEIWQIQKTEFSFQGRGMAVVRIKIKNTVNGKNVEVTHKSVASLDKVEIETAEMQYLYNDGTDLHFMNERTYQQLILPTSAVGDLAKFLKEGNKYYLLLHDDKPLSLRPPASVRLQVTDTELAVKGDTVSGAKKPATLETGAVVMVPLFIKKGDLIVINPETGAYAERASQS